MAVLGNVLTKVFGSRNDRLLKRYRRNVEQINAREPEVRAKTDAELRARTQELRKALTGKQLEVRDALPEVSVGSDERVVAGFVENPYWQYFCGEEFFVHELPCNPTSLVKWRKRIGPGGMERLLAETIAAAQREQRLSPQRSGG